ADRLANEGAHKDEPDHVDVEVRTPEVRLTGAKLSKMTQARVYAAIRETKMEKYEKRAATQQVIATVQEQVEDVYNHKPTEAGIWRAIRNKTIHREARFFLWMTAHNAYMVGENWLRQGFSDEYRIRSVCTHCGQMESMEHILFKCRSPGQAQIWKEIKFLFEQKGLEWCQPNLGEVVACATP
ncbi:hypothetical protein FISHEDRAFT_11291, partial [Fistulina hepatica ATCC 64428]